MSRSLLTLGIVASVFISQKPVHESIFPQTTLPFWHCSLQSRIPISQASRTHAIPSLNFITEAARNFPILVTKCKMLDECLTIGFIGGIL